MALHGCQTLSRSSEAEPQTPSAILSEARSTALQISNLKLKDEALGLIATFQTIAGDLPSAEETAVLIQSNLIREVTLTDIAGIAARSGDIATAERLTAGFTEDIAKTRAQSIIAIALAHSGKTPEALQRAAEIKNEGKRAFVLLEILANQAEQGDLPGAESTAAQVPESYGALRGYEPEPFAPTQSRAFAYLAEIQSGRQEIAESVRLARRITDPDEQGIAFKHIVAAILGGKNYDHALKVLALAPREEAKTCGLINLATNYAESGNIEEGLRVARSIKLPQKTIRCTHFPGTPLTLAPTTVSSVVLMSAVKSGHTQAALATAEGFPGKEDRELARLAIAIAQAKSGNPNGGLSTISNPALQDSDDALKEIASAFAKAGQHEQAFQTIQRIESEELREDMQGQMVFYLAEHGDNSRALQTLHQLSDRKNKIFAYTAIAESQAHKGEQQEALKTALSIESDHDRNIVIGKVATTTTHTIGSQAALQWVRELPNIHQRVYGLLGVVKSLLTTSTKKDIAEDLPWHFR